MCFKKLRFDTIPCYYDHDDPEASFDMPLETPVLSEDESEGEGESSDSSISSGFLSNSAAADSTYFLSVLSNMVGVIAANPGITITEVLHAAPLLLTAAAAVSSAGNPTAAATDAATPDVTTDAAATDPEASVEEITSESESCRPAEERVHCLHCGEEAQVCGGQGSTK